MRPRRFHQTDPRISSDLQSPLSHGCPWVGGTQTAVAGVDQERVYPTQFVPLGSLDFVCKQERWYNADVHWVMLVEKNDYQEPLHTPQDRWLVQSGGRSQNIFKDWLVIWVPLSMDSHWGYSQNHLSYKVWELRVCSNIVQVNQCTCELCVWYTVYSVNI